MNKDVRQLVRQLIVIPGVTVKHSAGHLKVMRDDKFLVTLPSTPSDHRWRDNSMRELKKHGLTPRTRELAPEFTVEEEISIDKLRDALIEVFRKPGEQAAFARFTAEVSDVLGIPGYKNPKSAEASLHIFKGGGGLRPDKQILLEETLRMYRQRQASEARALRSYTPTAVLDADDDDEPEDKPEPGYTPPDVVQLEVDLRKLNALLERVGVTIVIK